MTRTPGLFRTGNIGAYRSLSKKREIAASLDDMIPVVSVRLEEDEIQAAVEVMRSGRLRQGEVCARFEDEFADLTGARHAIACTNGTAALQLAYQAILKPGDEVLCPGYTFIATASMLLASGAVPVLCEVEPGSFCIDVDDAARRLTKKTRAIAAVHLYGNTADIDAVEALARAHGLAVIYDAAQAHLARYRDRPLGEFGSAVTYSFYPTKNMTTGEGGMVTVNDEALAERIRLLRDHGLTPGRPYHHETIGFNFRLTDIAAAIGLKQLAKLPDRTQKRRDNASLLTDRLAAIPQIICPYPSAGAWHVYHQYTIRLKLDKLDCTRSEFAQAMAEAGVATAIHYPSALTQQPAILGKKRCQEPFLQSPSAESPSAATHNRSAKKVPDTFSSLPICEQLAREVLCLPVHHDLTDAQVKRIAQVVTDVAAGFAR